MFLVYLVAGFWVVGSACSCLGLQALVVGSFAGGLLPVFGVLAVGEDGEEVAGGALVDADGQEIIDDQELELVLVLAVVTLMIGAWSVPPMLALLG